MHMAMDMVTKIMTDIHNHLLFGIDDGSKSIEDSIDVLKSMSAFGYKNVILTPHYIRDSKYNSSREHNLALMNTLQAALNENNISINLYLGNEIFIDDDIVGLLESDEISSLNDTKYLLIELPMTGVYDGYKEVLSDLIKRGYQVVLAHPERYISFQKDFNKIYELESIGVIFQSNIDSLNGKYGNKALKTIKRLLKEKKISYLATDIHHKKHDYDEWNVSKRKALKYISEEEYDYLVNINPSKLIG